MKVTGRRTVEARGQTGPVTGPGERSRGGGQLRSEVRRRTVEARGQAGPVTGPGERSRGGGQLRPEVRRQWPAWVQGSRRCDSARHTSLGSGPPTTAGAGTGIDLRSGPGTAPPPPPPPPRAGTCRPRRRPRPRYAAWSCTGTAG